ncbi:diguanylate cyclase [Psychrobacillus sp. FSL K6-4615]|uniref:diguanylate cyclase domain-containing protein n=1 Tax=Psychrobacillus sp. FSL K6-4615 TaxID=2921551 RepID=UPI0030FAA7C5
MINENTPFIFLYIDLDRCKNINDSFGHFTGDSLLMLVTARIKKFYNTTGELYRIGGDEFDVLIKGQAERTKMLENAKLLIQKVEEPFNIEEMEIHISCSIGIASFPLHGSSYKEIHRAADLALRWNKKGKEIIPPNDFIPFVEETGLIIR